MSVCRCFSRNKKFFLDNKNNKSETKEIKSEVETKYFVYVKKIIRLYINIINYAHIQKYGSKSFSFISLPITSFLRGILILIFFKGSLELLLFFALI